VTAILLNPITVAGEQIIAPTTVYCPEDGVFKGYVHTAALNAQSIWDEQLASPIYLQAGGCWVRNASSGDYGELAVVDKDDVLGLFAAYGLTVGVDVLELRKHIRTLYFPPGGSEFSLDFETKSYVPAGLYLREIYVSTATSGEQPVLGVRYKFYEV
jgi:hypothetical protein